MSREKIKINQINPVGTRGEKETLLQLTLFNTNATSKLPLIDNLLKGPPTWYFWKIAQNAQPRFKVANATLIGLNTNGCQLQIITRRVTEA